jgi:Zn-dependent peptidase ImmA (M78 family)
MGERKPTDTIKFKKERSFRALIRRLNSAGFEKEFVSRAILPDWWDDRCSDDPGLIQDLEIRVARFLNAPLASVRNQKVPLVAPAYAGAQLRRVREIDRDRLAPAIHAAIRIASAVIRNLRGSRAMLGLPPSDPREWRRSLQKSTSTLTLKDVAADLWNRGIPVVPAEILPAPSFQGMACIVEDRPVIMLGHKHDEPSRAAFIIAHETEHVIAGDCESDRPVVDDEYEISDESDIEVRADAYAKTLLVDDVVLSISRGESFKELAQKATAIERSTGADASSLVFAWAQKTGDYATATMAARALYRAVGARNLLQRLFKENVDVDGASETDRDLIRCVTLK